jgi:hypothetical protein
MFQDESVNPAVILFSVIALEKFAQTSENKVSIKKYFENTPDSHPLEKVTIFK